MNAPLTRRHFLTTSAVAFLASQAGPANAAAAPVKGGFIDAHVHVWTSDTRRYPLASGASKRKISPPDFSPETLLSLAEKEGVTRIVLIQPGMYREDNRYLLDSMAAHPGRFSGVAIVDENASGLRDRMKDLAKQGVLGFRLTPRGKDLAAWLGSPGMKEMWKTAAEEHLNLCLLINPDALGAVDKMCLQFPQTPVVVDHFARVGADGVITRAHLDRLLHMSVHKNLKLKVSAFYALNKKTAPYEDLGSMIQECHRYFGPSRLMWGSDSPHQLSAPHTYRDSIALIRDRLSFLSASDKQWMLGKTAEKTFFGA